MGFRDRDWYREEGTGTRPVRTSAVGALLIANAIAFVAQAIAIHARDATLARWFWLTPHDVVAGGRLWQPLTSMFFHDPNDLFHAIFNMLVLWMFGPGVEGRLGTPRFLALYFGGGLAAAAAFIAWGTLQGPFTVPAGASGAVLAVAVYDALANPRDCVLLFLIFPMRTLYAMAIVVVIEAVHFGTLHGGAGFANAAHFGGAVFAGAFYRLGVRPPRKRRVISEVAMKAQVDTLLDKIHQHGIASLTLEEREFLERASRTYRGDDHP